MVWWTRSKKTPTSTGEIKSRFDSLVSQVRAVAEMEDPIMPENIYTRSEMYSFAIFMLGRLLESEVSVDTRATATDQATDRAYVG